MIIENKPTNKIPIRELNYGGAFYMRENCM